jgi:hypothetical protein
MARPIPLARPAVRGRRIGHHLSLLGWAYLFLSWGVVVAATVYALTGSIRSGSSPSPRRPS